MASLASDGSKSSAVSISSRRATAGPASNSTSATVGGAGDNGNGAGGAGDSESSHLEDRVLKGLSELQSRCRFVLPRLFYFKPLTSSILVSTFFFSFSVLEI